MKFNSAKGSELGKNFVSLKDGDQVIGVFRGEPVEFQTHWGEQRSEICHGTGCPKCAQGDKPGFRFRLNLIVQGEDKKPVAKVLEQGWKLYKALGELNDDYPLEDNYVKIKRSGKTKNDTVYTVLPVANQKISPETKKMLESVPLLPLHPSDPFWNPVNQPAISDAAEVDAEGVPF